jgi:PKD repeat protein
MQWLFGWNMTKQEVDPAWLPPNSYTFTLYDEGTSPQEGGGTPINMKLTDRFAFSLTDNEIRYFHIEVNAGHNHPPICAIAYTPSCIKGGDEVNFDSQASDSDGEIVNITWNFGDGNTGSGMSASHIYNATGDYEVICTVQDDDGDITSCAKTLKVKENLLVCSIVYQYYPPINGQYVRFFALADSPCGQIVSFSWDFGDGSPPESGQMVVHYFDPGIYQVTLTVTDDLGLTAICSTTIDTRLVLNIVCPLEPIVVDTCTMPDLRDRVIVQYPCLPPGPLDLEPPDPGYKIFQDPEPGSILEPGPNMVVFTVIDTCENMRVCEAQVFAPPNRPPVCQFDIKFPIIIQIYPPPPLNVVILDATSSFDPDEQCSDKIISFEWNLDNDGAFDDASGPIVYVPTIQQTIYYFCLKVTDQYGSSSVCCQEFIPYPDQPPICDLSIIKNPVTPNQVRAEVNCIDPEGGMTSSMIDWGDGSLPASGPAATHIYPESGIYQICATCVDQSGNASTCCQKVEVPQLPKIDVRLVNIETKGSVHLNDKHQRAERIRIRIRNESRDKNAVADVFLYRWRYKTTNVLGLVNTWTKVSVPKNKTVVLAPEFYYHYSSDDQPTIKWKAVVMLLNGFDPDLSNNTKFRKVNVHK